MLEELKYQLASKIHEADQWKAASHQMEGKIQEMIARDLHARQITNWLQLKEKAILDLQFQNELLLRDLADYKIKVQQLNSERAQLLNQLENSSSAKIDENSMIISKSEYHRLLQMKNDKEEILGKLVVAYARIEALESEDKY